MKKRYTLYLAGLLYVLFQTSVNAQNPMVEITGTIIDSDGKTPLPGAVIEIPNSNTGTTSDVDGNFKLITYRPLPVTIRIRSVGYLAQEVQIQEPLGPPLSIALVLDNSFEVTVTSRRRKEDPQNVPIPVTVIGGQRAEDAGAFNVNRVKELVPSVQLYASNARNTTLNIRGLGSTFGLTNDGLDPGVGFYVDGVYQARPAATSTDFLDIQQIEVLRGPQGTLFGKNTTAGAFNITTRKPSFTPGATFELSYGNYGFVQAKSSITGGLTKKIAARLSFSGTQRDGTVQNIRTDQPVNDLNNLGVRSSVLYLPTDNIGITISGDWSRQRPVGYATVVAGVAPTLRPAYRQFNAIIADLNYTLPTTNAFERKIDADAPFKADQDLGGAAVNVDWRLGSGTLTSTSAWRYWNWQPSNDRDFIGVDALRKSQANSVHNQYSQEFRYAGKLNSRISAVVGVYGIGQQLLSSPNQIEEAGAAQWRFAQNTTSPLWATPGLLDGYGISTTSSLYTFSGAVFGQLDIAVTDKFHVLPGVRYNYDQKSVDFQRTTYGGLQTADTNLIKLKRSVYSNQSFYAKVEDTNLSGNITAQYKFTEAINAYATFSTNFKPVGINLGGLPTQNGRVMTELATVKPEEVTHYEVGLKTRPLKHSTLNFTVFNTDIKNYQTSVQSPELGVNRGYLANAEKVNVRGFELEANVTATNNFSFNGGVSYTEGKYVTFTNAPLSLEETGKKDANGRDLAFTDISGQDLPGISRWATTLGAELSRSGKFFGKSGKYFVGADTYYRTKFSSSPTPSQYLVINDYALLNARIGFRAAEGVSFFFWGRNITNTKYFEQLLPAAGNSGLYSGVLGDPRMYGITLRYSM
jgi:iron complex outermembrane recepter protein